MKRNERWLALIRSDEQSDRETGFDDDGDPRVATILIPAEDLRSVLAWYAAVSGDGELTLLPRDFELTLVPGPDDLQ